MVVVVVLAITVLRRETEDKKKKQSSTATDLLLRVRREAKASPQILRLSGCVMMSNRSVHTSSSWPSTDQLCTQHDKHDGLHSLWLSDDVKPVCPYIQQLTQYQPVLHIAWQTWWITFSTVEWWCPTCLSMHPAADPVPNCSAHSMTNMMDYIPWLSDDVQPVCPHI